MNIKQKLRNFLAKLCEKNYAAAETLLQDVVTEKMSNRIKKEHDKIDDSKDKTSSKKKDSKDSKVSDMNNDGKIDKQDKYLKKRDTAIKNSMKKKKK